MIQLRYWLLFFLSIPISLFAQLNGYLSIPNPSAYLSDWETSTSIAILTVTNSTRSELGRMSVRVEAQLKKGDLIIATAPSNIFEIPGPGPASDLPSVTTVYTSNKIARWNEFQFTGRIGDVVSKTGRLPEGDYTLCVHIEQYPPSVGNLNPSTTPCSDFIVSYPQPPQLITPADESELNIPYPTFQWTPIIIFGKLKVTYNLKIAEILHGQTSKQAIDANVPIYDEKIVNTTSKSYPPSAFPLEKNKRYAWQVQALTQQADRMGGEQPIGANNGKSEIWTFTYNKLMVGTPVLVEKKKEKEKTYEKFEFPFNTFLKGKLLYNFPSINGWAIPSSPVYPLKNVTIKFMQKLAILEKKTGKMIIIPQTMWDKELAVTTTDDNGEYSFICLMADSMKLLMKNKTWPINGNSIYGDLYRVGSIMVDNPYYCSPDSSIMIQPNQNKTIEPITTKARSYVLSLKVMPSAYQQQAQYTSGPLSGIIVYLLRKIHPVDAPEMEGHNRPNPPEIKFGMEVVSKDTTDNTGLINFLYLSKNIGPNDKYYINAEPDPKGDKNYFFWGPVEYQFEYKGDKAIYSADYSTAMDFKTIKMHPFMPKVEGYVYRADNPNQPVWGAKVKMLKFALLFWDTERSMLSFWNGMFKFPDLAPVYDNDGNITGPMRGMSISKYGFRDTGIAINNGDPLKLGQKVFLEKILLEPAAQVHGLVVDEDGKGVKAKVTIGDGATVDAIPNFSAKKDNAGNFMLQVKPAPFECPAILGSQKIIISPTDQSLFADTININITKTDQDIGTFVMKKKMQRIQVWVYPESKPGMMTVPKGITGAKVEVRNINPTLKAVTNNDGSADFKFITAGDSFSIKIDAPDNLDFEGQTIAVFAPPSKDWTYVVAHLKKAARISGRVYAGKDVPIPGARVFLDLSSNTSSIEVISDLSGKYTLRNVPLGDHIIRAVKGGNYIGDSVSALITENGASIYGYVPTLNGTKKKIALPVDSVNFYLSVYADMDITKLLGFPIEVTNLVAKGNEVKISGNFLKLIPNNFFAPDTNFDCKPAFSNIVIVPGSEINQDGVPLAYPKDGKIKTDRNFIDLTVYQKLVGKSEDGNGLKVEDGGNGVGLIKGKVFLNASSFNDASIKFAENGFYLALPNVSDPAGKMIIPTINSSGNPAVDAPDGFPVVSKTGGLIQYELFGPNGFTVKTDSNKSYLKDDAVHLASVLHTNFQNVTPSDINLNIGEVILRTNKLEPIKGTKKISIPLEKWSLDSEDWTISKVGGFILDGTLKTGKVDVPFAALEIKPTQFVSTANTFQLDKMSLSGIVPLTVTGNPYFGYDAGQKHWSLSIAPKVGETSCAYFTDLPGMKNGEKILINNFFLLSNGDAGFAIDPNIPPLTFYNVVTFKPTMMNVYDTYIHLPGTMDLHIPNIAGQSTAIDYKKNSQGNLAMYFQTFPFGFTTNGVSLSFPATGEYPENLDKDGFICRGTVSEEGKFKFNVKLYKTVDSISIWTEPNQELNVTSNGSSKFTKVDGSMNVDNGNWTNFWFAGDMTGTEGANGRITFTVIGDVVANQQAIGVKNIDTPFGNLALVYDFENHRLLGTLDFSKGIDVGGATVKGTAEMLVDSDGWYFLTGGTLEFEGFKGQVAMVFGNYPMVTSISEKFKNYSWIYQHKGNFPPAFPTFVKGFFMEGEAQIPVLIPDFDFNFILVSGHFYIHVGADMRFGMNFYETTSLAIGQTVFGEIGIGVGGSIGIACAGVSASALVDLSFDGQFFKNGNYSVIANANLQICGSAYCGWGICDSDCDGWCDKHEESGCIDIGVKGTISNNDKNLEFYLK